MWHRVVATCLLLAALCLGKDASAIEIGRFDVSIRVASDSTFVVTETITVDFGDQRKHGIFRTIPVDYERTETLGGVPVATRYSIRLKVVDVKDGEEKPIPFTTSKEGPDLFIRIGDPTPTGDGHRGHSR